MLIITRCVNAFVQVEAALTTQPRRLLAPQELPSSSQSRGDAVDEDEFLDPITFDIINDPVFGSDGCTYDRSTAYQLMTQGSVMPGCAEPFRLRADNVHFRGRLRLVHPGTEDIMRQQREDTLKVRYESDVSRRDTRHAS